MRLSGIRSAVAGYLRLIFGGAGGVSKLTIFEMTPDWRGRKVRFHLLSAIHSLRMEGAHHPIDTNK
jgi:hypothetical protein